MGKVNVFHPITRLIVGGAQQNTMEICAYLNPRRYAAQIISGAQTGPEGEIISEVQKRQIPLTILPDLVREPHLAKDFAVLRKMVHIFRTHKAHIVHTHSSKAGILGRWAAKIAGVPVIIHTVHGWGHNVQRSFIKRALFTFLERISARISDKLIVVSYLNEQKGNQDRIGTKELYTTIHSCINIKDFTDPGKDIRALKQQLGINPEAPVVGTVGRLSRQKNPLDFVRVAAAVKKIHPPAQFIFVGDGPLRAETENLIRQLHLTNDVFLPGLRSDVAALLGCMDVFILTSLWEGLPRVIPQALAAGLPVVANAVDGVCEVIKDGENGFLTDPHNVALMAKKVARLLENASLRRDMAGRGRSLVEQEFSVWQMMIKIESLYEALLTKKAVRV